MLDVIDKQFVPFLLGIFATLIVYFIKRYAEKTREVEELNLMEKQINVLKQLEESGLNYQDAKEIHGCIVQKIKLIARIDDSTQSINSSKQYDINVKESCSREEADEILDGTLERISNILEDGVYEKWREADTAWRNYANCHAEAVREIYKGGSIQNAIHQKVLKNLTLDWISAIEVEFDTQ